jgi:hypothetical protein
METISCIKKEKEELRVKLGINYDKINAQCPKGHQLKMQRGINR